MIRYVARYVHDEPHPTTVILGARAHLQKLIIVKIPISASKIRIVPPESLWPGYDGGTTMSGIFTV